VQGTGELPDVVRRADVVHMPAVGSCHEQADRRDRGQRSARPRGGSTSWPSHSSPMST
jgi:hypothetical protein